MRGLILMATAGQVDADVAWLEAREHLLAMSAAVLDSHQCPVRDSNPPHRIKSPALYQMS